MGSGNELVDYSRALCLGADQKARGLWDRDCNSLKQRSSGAWIDDSDCSFIITRWWTADVTRWGYKIGAQNFTAKTKVKSSNAEMWVAIERTKSGKANMMHLSRQVASPRTMQASVLKRKLAKSHWAGFIIETLLKRERKVFHHKRSCRIARVTGWCFACEEKLRKVLSRRDKKIRVA